MTRKVLDYGEVTLVDVFGTDARIVEAARASYSKGTKRTSTDEQLIRYLLRHHHTTPFEMCEVLFHLKLPIFVARQLVRHRTASINEVSARYSELPDELYVPEINQLGKQSSDNKQGRQELASSEVERASFCQDFINDSNRAAYFTYQNLLRENVSREISRIVLPVSTYTEMFWKMDLHNFLRFLKLRMDAHAQYEFRVFANAMCELVRPHFPITFGAFDDYILNAHTLSKGEQKLLAEILKSGGSLTSLADSAARHGLSSRELTEFQTWLTSLTQSTSKG